MGLFLQFFDVTDQPLSFQALGVVLKNIDPRFDLVAIPEPSEYYRTFLDLDGKLHASVAILQPERGNLNRELQLALESLDEGDGTEEEDERVEQVLLSTKRIIEVDLGTPGPGAPFSLARMDALRDWFFSTRSGLLRVRGEGYYAGHQLVLGESGSAEDVSPPVSVTLPSSDNRTYGWWYVVIGAALSFGGFASLCSDGEKIFIGAMLVGPYLFFRGIYLLQHP